MDANQGVPLLWGKKTYCGVGATDAPLWALDLAVRWGRRAAALGYDLSSGNALGMDRAFEDGCDAAGGGKHIWLPWRGHRGSDSPLYEVDDEATAVARLHHWNFDNQSKESKLFLGRDSTQVLGPKPLSNPQPVRYLLCWTADGSWKATTRATGGTGQAIRIAIAHHVPVYNLGHPPHRGRVEKLLERFEREGPTER